MLALATPGAAPLPEAALSLPPIAAPPPAPGKVPVLGHALLFSGPYEPPMYNVWHKAFRDASGGPGGNGATPDTMILVLRGSLADPTRGGRDLGARDGALGWDDARSAEETIYTSDPEIVGELVKREADFPKTWNRPTEVRLSEFTSNGIFTSSTDDPDWASIHGLLPRFFNALKVQAYYPIS